MAGGGLWRRGRPTPLSRLAPSRRALAPSLPCSLAPSRPRALAPSRSRVDMAGGGHWRRGRADRRPRRRPRADALAPSRRCCVAALLPRSLAPSCLAPLAPSRSRWCKPRAGQRGCWSGQSDRGGADEGGPRLGDEASHGRRRGRHGSLKSITASQDADALCREWPTHRVASDSDGCLKHVSTANHGRC